MPGLVTVTARTAAASFASAAVVGDDLILTRGDGTTVDAGNVRGATGATSPPSGTAGGDLTGTYPNPTVKALAITDAKVAAANKDGAAGTASMRTLGTGAAQAAPGNDSRFLPRSGLTITRTGTPAITTAAWQTLPSGAKWDGTRTPIGASMGSGVTGLKVLVAGTYDIQGYGHFSAIAAAGMRGIQLLINGVAVVDSMFVIGGVSGCEAGISTPTYPIALAVNDLIDLQFYQASGSSLAISGVWLRANRTD